MTSNLNQNFDINFASETKESLADRGITSIDFVEEFVGKYILATAIKHIVGCGSASQDGLIYELTGAEVRFALLTNGNTRYSDNLEELEN